MFLTQSNDRLDAADQIHIFTTGRFDSPFESEVEFLRQADVSIYSIGVGDVDITQLNTLHRRAKQPSYFWHADDFTDYLTVMDRFYNTICLGAPGPVIVDPPSSGKQQIIRKVTTSANSMVNIARM